MVDRDAVPHRYRHDPFSEARDDAGRLVPEHGGKLGSHVPVGHVGPAHAAREHVAYNLARARHRVLDLLDTDVAERDGAGDPHGGRPT
jgi:hypothetical protein